MRRCFSDSQIWQSTWNTLYYMVLTVPIGVMIALILAVLLNTKMKGRDLYRGIYFMPMIVAPARDRDGLEMDIQRGSRCVESIFAFVWVGKYKLAVRSEYGAYFLCSHRHLEYGRL